MSRAVRDNNPNLHYPLPTFDLRMMRTTSQQHSKPKAELSPKNLTCRQSRTNWNLGRKRWSELSTKLHVSWCGLGIHVYVYSLAFRLRGIRAQCKSAQSARPVQPQGSLMQPSPSASKALRQALLRDRNSKNISKASSNYAEVGLNPQTDGHGMLGLVHWPIRSFLASRRTTKLLGAGERLTETAVLSNLLPGCNTAP